MKIFRKVKGIEEPECDRYDMLVVDVDGTLVNSKKEISEHTKAVLMEAQQRGKTVAIATGRSIAGVRHVAKNIGLPEYGGYVIASNGTTVVNCHNGKCIYNQEIPSDMYEPVFEAAKMADVGILVFHDDAKELISGNGINEYVVADAKACDVAIREADHFIKELTFPINKFLLAGDPDRMKEVERIMKEKFADRLNIFRSDPYYLEVLPKFVDKGVAVEKLMKHLDIKKAKVICVGDSYNDLPMLRCAGLGVAMGNAQEEVREASDYVTASNDEDGVAKLVEKFMTPISEEEQGKSEETVAVEKTDSVGTDDLTEI